MNSEGKFKMYKDWLSARNARGKGPKYHMRIVDKMKNVNYAKLGTLQ